MRERQTAAFEQFRSLPPVEPIEIVGLWQGRGIPAGHPLDGVLENLGWFGKRFRADMRADALLFWTRERRLIAIDPAQIPVCLALRFHKLGRTGAARILFSYLRRGFQASGPVACLRIMDNNIVLDLTALMHGGVWHRQSGKLDLRDQSRLSEG